MEINHKQWGGVKATPKTKGNKMKKDEKVFGECGAVCYDKKCDRTFTEKEYNDGDYLTNGEGWSIDHSSGIYFCPNCSKYLSLAETISDDLNSFKEYDDIPFEIILDSAYMIIDTYQSYKEREAI